MAERTSFRQVGKEHAGKLYKGALMDAYNRVSQASIPSKFELVLAKQEEAKAAFGKRASRFSMTLQEEIPGPGHYPSTVPHSTSPSYSKKGFLSGFVSKMRRFRPRQYSSLAPGPGAYSPPNVRKLSNPAPIFARKTSIYQKEPEITPAPGTYDPVIEERVKVLAISFKSKQKRLEDRTSDGPGPCKYDPKYSFVWSSAQSLTSPFRLPVNARRFQVNLYDPHSSVNEDPLPGPGAYSLSSSLDNALNASFDHHGLDRFGCPIQPKVSQFSVPGPGTYNLQPKEPEKSPVNSSSFMSESDRDPLKLKRNPGPAFYRPVIIAKKKSFHLNAERKWV